MKENSRYISARHVANAELLLGVEVFEFAPSGELSRLIQAESAQYREGRWQLQAVRIQQFDREMTSGVFPFERLTLQASASPLQELQFPFAPETLQLMAQDKKNWSMIALAEQIELLAHNGMQTQILELALWRKLAHPISILAMLVIAVPLLLQAGRSTSMGGRIVMGVVIGLSFFLLNRVVGDMAALAELPAAVSAMALPMVMLLVGWLWLVKLR
jgi:lipopolysaccharide export system permease protein